MLVDVNKIKSYLEFAIKSGNINFGYDNILKKRNNKLIIITNEINNKVFLKLQKLNTKIIKLKNINLEMLLNRKNVKVIGITNENLAIAICKFNDLYEIIN